jgi:hypothetical protein
MKFRRCAGVFVSEVVFVHFSMYVAGTTGGGPDYHCTHRWYALGLICVCVCVCVCVCTCVYGVWFGYMYMCTVCG